LEIESVTGGKGKYAMAEYEKIKRKSIPLDADHLILPTTEVAAGHLEIINSILNQLRIRQRKNA
jgi:hypothetical protein